MTASVCPTCGGSTTCPVDLYGRPARGEDVRYLPPGSCPPPYWRWVHTRAKVRTYVGPHVSTCGARQARRIAAHHGWRPMWVGQRTYAYVELR